MARNDPTPIPPFRDDGQTDGPQTINELCDRFERWAFENYRRPNGSHTGTHKNVPPALRPLRDAAGDMPPGSVTARLALYVQEQLAATGDYARSTIRDYMGVIKRMFRWAAEREYVRAATWAEVNVVSNLQPSRSKAREPKRIRPVDWEIVRQTLPFLSRHIGAMVIVQWYTGMRSGELCIMRPCDIERSGATWLYTPAFHKSERFGKSKAIPLGPRAQTVLRPFIASREATAYIFSPREARAEFQLMRTLGRVTPLSCGNRVGTNRKGNPQWKPGERYTPCTYRQAIARACDHAFPHPDIRPMPYEQLSAQDAAELEDWRKQHRWHPHQLRHAAATRLRHELGIEAARVVLGHSSIRITEIYAEADVAKAIEVMEKVG